MVLRLLTAELLLEGVHGQHAADVTRVITKENATTVSMVSMGMIEIT